MIGFRRRTPANNAPASEEHRSIDLEGREISYRLRRSARRSFALHVDPRGVRVAVPGRAALEEIERFVLAHGNWILEKLDVHARRAAVSAFDPCDGSIFPVMGRSSRLRVGPVGRPRWIMAADGVEELHVPAKGDRRAAIVRALRQRALPWFEGRVETFCRRLGIAPPPLRLSSARTRWGSCSARSGIRLHWRLIHLPPELSDYVVAHEVAHLLEMNHSPRFWAVVGELYPDWKRARVRLREAANTLPGIGPDPEVRPMKET